VETSKSAGVPASRVATNPLAFGQASALAPAAAARGGRSRGHADAITPRATTRGSVLDARPLLVAVALDHGCAAKTWATAPPLKTVVLIDSMVSGPVNSRSPAPRTTG
jgi:hypothetical protein